MDNAKIGANIQKFRKFKKETQKGLATAIGKTESTIAKYERGLVEIPLSVLHNIATVLSVTLDDLLGKRSSVFSPELLSWFAFEEFLLSLGYKIDGDLAEGYLWIEYDGKGYSDVDMEELKQVEQSVKSYTRFLLHEIMSKDKNPVKLKKDGD